MPTSPTTGASSSGATMMALRAHTPGGPEVLVYEPAPVPTPAPDEVLVAVHAAGITFAELTWTETWQRDGRDRTPVVPSHEVSGVVTGAGDDVTELDIGSEVYGLIRFDRDGAAADYVAVPAADLARKPATVSHTVAAAVPLAALTAWQAWYDHAALRPGERVLVHGGAGGVGAFAVQLARAGGAEVTSTARGTDLPLVQRLGAQRVIDYEGGGWTTEGPVYDVVLDTVGGRTLHESFTVLRRGGRLITLQAPPSPERAQYFDVQATFFVVTPDPGQLAHLAGLVDSGELQVLIAATYPLAEGRAAFESATGPQRSPGKTVLVVRP
jgi:NADPH:quinone reductase-like Zn-dependent oxidoreductase